MKRIVEDLKRRGIKKYTIYKLDGAFPFYLLDLGKLNISLPCATYFEYITIEDYVSKYNVVFYDGEEMFTAQVNISFTEKGAIEYFNDLLLDMSQKQGVL